jgi:glycosyltransferase involved in cell wall biosynthesis
LLPSRYEGLSIALLEAMASGVPVVATAVSGTPEALANGRHGYLIPPDNPHALADILRTALRADNTALAAGARLHVVRNHNAGVNLPRAIALWEG